MAAVRRVCPPWLGDQAEDLAHVAYLKVVDLDRRRRAAGRPEPRPEYLWKVAYTTVIDEIRRRRRRREVSLEEGVVPFETASPAPDPETSAAGRLLGEAIRDCLRQLIPARRTPVLLRLAGHTVSELADLIGATPKRAENLVYRGLADLRACLRGKGVEP